MEGIGFKNNPNNPCVANRMIGGKQHTVTCHIEDLKSSHEDSKVNDDFLTWLDKMYGDAKVAPVKATRGKIHEYLGMRLDFTIPGKLKIDMVDYVNNMINEFPDDIMESKYPWNDNLFKVDEKDNKLLDAKTRVISQICSENFVSV